MTQKEFEARIGTRVAAEAYANIEQTYMNTNLDKDEFCKAYMKAPQTLIELEKQTVLARELYEERNRLANFLIEQAEKLNAPDLRDKVSCMLGEREYIRRKLEKGFNLWEEDRAILIELLRK